jgi:glycerol uptake facilitator-like aquaporin
MGSATLPRLVAEVIGTAMLIFFGVAALANTGGDPLVGAVAFLVTAAVAAWAFGGHFNPWITLAVALRGSLDWLGAVVIIAAQLAGGIIGALLVWAVTGARGVDIGLGATRLSPETGVLVAILAETLAVFLLCCVFFSAGANSGIGMGLAYAAGTLAIFAITGASMNFARTLGPDVVLLFAGDQGSAEGFKQVWVYAVSGFLGAALAAFLYPLWKPGPAKSTP